MALPQSSGYQKHVLAPIPGRPHRGERNPCLPMIAFFPTSPMPPGIALDKSGGYGLGIRRPVCLRFSRYSQRKRTTERTDCFMPDRLFLSIDNWCSLLCYPSGRPSCSQSRIYAKIRCRVQVFKYLLAEKFKQLKPDKFWAYLCSWGHRLGKCISQLFNSIPQSNMGADPIPTSVIERHGCRHSNHGGN